MNIKNKSVNKLIYQYGIKKGIKFYGHLLTSLNSMYILFQGDTTTLE